MPVYGQILIDSDATYSKLYLSHFGLRKNMTSGFSFIFFFIEVVRLSLMF